MSKVRIIHVSDLHLFVDCQGKRRKYKELALSSRILADMTSPLRRLANRIGLENLLSGIDQHSDTALEAMLATLDDLLAEQVPQVVIQTGDVSTFGALVASEDVDFPEWQYWRNRVRKDREQRTEAWIDLFGNHDVWPGTLPILEAPCIERVVQALRDQFFPDTMPIVHRIVLETFVLELYAVNSVLAGPIDNTRAIGGLPQDVVDMTTPFEGAVEPLSALTECIAGNANAAGPVIRGLLMHHPPHHFDKPGIESSEGGLRDAARLGEWLKVNPIEFVLAGHRHYVHPPRASRQAPPQDPLPARTLQLVCGSPTQESSVRAPPPSQALQDADVIPLRPREASQIRPSFSVYELSHVGDKIELKRIVYEHASKLAYKFVPTAADTFCLSALADSSECVIPRNA
jgi:3',5'-cyclic AMP phosphodiesterase CpdA